MKQSNENHGVVRQNDKIVSKSQKHDANLRKNSTLYFQIGLIMCLLASYSALEMSFANTTDETVSVIDPFDADVLYVKNNYKVYEEVVPEKPEPKVKEKQAKVITDVIDVVDNTEVINKVFALKVEAAAVTKKQVLATDDPTLDIQKPVEPVTMLAVQKVPIYPGCERSKTNEARRKCMSQKLNKLISKKFDSDLGSDLGLSGKHKIHVSFKINKQGNVEILRTRATHPRLEREAVRVVNKVPRMEPGKNDNKPVEVLYNLPITLNIQN